jgi:hypothetical protein
MQDGESQARHLIPAGFPEIWGAVAQALHILHSGHARSSLCAWARWSHPLPAGATGTLGVAVRDEVGGAPHCMGQLLQTEWASPPKMVRRGTTEIDSEMPPIAACQKT